MILAVSLLYSVDANDELAGAYNEGQCECHHMTTRANNLLSAVLTGALTPSQACILDQYGTMEL